MKKNYLVIGSVLLMVLIFAIAAFIYNSRQTQKQIKQATEQSGALIRAHSPRKGNPDAKVTIVEFMDPACETCAKFHPFVKKLMASHPGKVNLVIRYAAFHQGSDLMVKILEAVKKQGKFWEVLEKMFETQPYWASHHNPQPQAFWNYLQRSGFDMAYLEKAINDPEIIKVLERDQADIRRLGVNKTPTFFVNGKPLPSFGYEQLATLVNAEVAANY
ncbi:MAG: DsbA family protein [Deltaproteobacteria bacterium]|nr:DsbA family protein [Deltaproteobacteria bacterium]